MPIVIGWCEARSIAIALDGTEDPGRPLTHDLFKTFGDTYDITIQKVVLKLVTHNKTHKYKKRITLRLMHAYIRERKFNMSKRGK